MTYFVSHNSIGLRERLRTSQPPDSVAWGRPKDRWPFEPAKPSTSSSGTAHGMRVPIWCKWSRGTVNIESLLSMSFQRKSFTNFATFFNFSHSSDGLKHVVCSVLRTKVLLSRHGQSWSGAVRGHGYNHGLYLEPSWPGLSTSSTLVSSVTLSKIHSLWASVFSSAKWG